MKKSKAYVTELNLMKWRWSIVEKICHKTITLYILTLISKLVALDLDLYQMKNKSMYLIFYIVGPSLIHH